MTRRLAAVVCALALLAAGACRFERSASGRPGGSYAPEPDSAASAEVYAVLRGYYAAVTARDWKLVGAHFWPNGTITTIRVPAGDTAARVHTLTIEDFVARAGTARAGAFTDEPIRASVVTYGPLADAWVTYRSREGPTAQALVSRHGIDAFHLMRHEGRWRIVSLAFQNEVPGLPLGPAPRR